MHIASIATINFRNLRSVTLVDLPPALVVVGENASGKSNLMYALRLVLDPSLPETARHLTAEDFWDGLDRPFHGATISVTLELTGFDNDPEAKAVLDEFLVEIDPYVARLTYLYRPIAGRDPATGPQDYEVVLFGGNDEARRLGRNEWRYISLRLLPALRDAESDLHTARSPLRRLIARADVPEGTLESIVTSIDDATKPLHDEAELRGIQEALAERFDQMVGKLFAIEPSLGLLSTRPEQLLRSLRLFVDQERRRPVSQASLGTSNLLYLSLLLEEIEAQRADDLLVELVLAVEEPEAHLHPHVQRVLFRHLLQEQRALIVTTSFSPYR